MGNSMNTMNTMNTMKAEAEIKDTNTHTQHKSVSLVGPNHQHNRILKRETVTVETLGERLSHTIDRMLK
jgi:hypothetical protein